jgi:hypothetical protein
MARSFEWWRERLDGVEEQPDGSIKALCPAHADQNPSLHVSKGDNGSALVHCFTGCEYEDIVAAVDELPHVSVNFVRGSSSPDVKEKEQSPPARTEDFAKEKQLPLQALRKEGLGEHVILRFPDGASKLRTVDGKYVWCNGGSVKTHPLWPRPDSELPETVYFFEGETDALTARTILALPAFAITGGASTRFTVNHYRALIWRGVKHVVLCGDGDPPGQEWMRVETATVQASGLEVSTIELAEFYDPFGEGQKDLNELWLTCRDADDLRAELDAHTVRHRAKRPLLLSDVRELATEEPVWLVQDLISPSEKGLFHGIEKSYKTWVTLDLARAVTTGETFLGYEGWNVPQPCPVLLIEEEGHEIKFAQRVEAVFRGCDDAPFYLWHRHGFKLTDPAMVEALLEYVDEHDIALVQLDPFQRMKPGVEENSVKEMSLVWDAINRIVNQTRAAVWLVHHDNREGSYRGSSLTGGEPDFLLHVNVPQRGELAFDLVGRDVAFVDDGLLTVSFDHPARMHYEGFQVTISAGEATYQKVVALLDDEWRGTAYFADRLELGRKAVREVLNKAVSRGVAETKREGEHTTAPQFWRRTRQ